MPKDTSIKSVLIIGSGPIVIGQACEFDYSGSQASRSLREEGIVVSLINSNPATIMTDEVSADFIYLKPLTIQSIEEILQDIVTDLMLYSQDEDIKGDVQVYAIAPNRLCFANYGRSNSSKFM